MEKERMLYKVISLALVLSFICTNTVYSLDIRSTLRPPMASGHTVRGTAEPEKLEREGEEGKLHFVLRILLSEVNWAREEGRSYSITVNELWEKYKRELERVDVYNALAAFEKMGIMGHVTESSQTGKGKRRHRFMFVSSLGKIIEEAPEALLRTPNLNRATLSREEEGRTYIDGLKSGKTTAEISIEIPRTQIVMNLLEDSMRKDAVEQIKKWGFPELKETVNGMIKDWQRRNSPGLAAALAVAYWFDGNDDRAGDIRYQEKEWLDEVVDRMAENFQAFREGDIQPGFGDMNQAVGSTDLDILANIGTPAAVRVIARYAYEFRGQLFEPGIWAGAISLAHRNALPIILDNMTKRGVSVLINGRVRVVTDEVKRDIESRLGNEQLFVVWNNYKFGHFTEVSREPDTALVIDEIWTDFPDTEVVDLFGRYGVKPESGLVRALKDHRHTLRRLYLWNPSEDAIPGIGSTEITTIQRLFKEVYGAQWPRSIEARSTLGQDVLSLFVLRKGL